MCHNVKTLRSLSVWGPGGASIIRLGSSWLTSTLSCKLIYRSNMEAIWYDPFELKSKMWRNKLTKHSWVLGALHKIQGHHNVSKFRPHHSSVDVYKARQLKTSVLLTLLVIWGAQNNNIIIIIIIIFISYYKYNSIWCITIWSAIMGLQ